MAMSQRAESGPGTVPDTPDPRPIRRALPLSEIGKGIDFHFTGPPIVRSALLRVPSVMSQPGIMKWLPLFHECPDAASPL